MERTNLAMEERCRTLQKVVVNIDPENVTLKKVHFKTQNEFKST
jgi:hypothetical protein